MQIIGDSGSAFLGFGFLKTKKNENNLKELTFDQNQQLLSFDGLLFICVFLAFLIQVSKKNLSSRTTANTAAQQLVLSTFFLRGISFHILNFILFLFPQFCSIWFGIGCVTSNQKSAEYSPCQMERNCSSAKVTLS